MDLKLDSNSNLATFHIQKLACCLTRNVKSTVSLVQLIHLTLSYPNVAAHLGNHGLGWCLHRVVEHHCMPRATCALTQMQYSTELSACAREEEGEGERREREGEGGTERHRDGGPSQGTCMFLHLCAPLLAQCVHVMDLRRCARGREGSQGGTPSSVDLHCPGLSSRLALTHDSCCTITHVAHSLPTQQRLSLFCIPAAFPGAFQYG